MTYDFNGWGPLFKVPPKAPQGETKYFNSIQGWRIENIQADANSGEIPPVPPMDAFEPATDLTQDEHDDLPF